MINIHQNLATNKHCWYTGFLYSWEKCLHYTCEFFMMIVTRISIMKHIIRREDLIHNSTNWKVHNNIIQNYWTTYGENDTSFTFISNLLVVLAYFFVYFTCIEGHWDAYYLLCGFLTLVLLIILCQNRIYFHEPIVFLILTVDSSFNIGQRDRMIFSLYPEYRYITNHQKQRLKPLT